MGPSCLYLLVFVGKGITSSSVLPLLWRPMPPTLAMRPWQVAPSPGLAGLSEQWQSFWESTGRAN